MDCPIHGTVSPVEDDDFEITCPQCRKAWIDRGDLYELPRREPDDPPRPRPSRPPSGGPAATR